jgi:hypothetical protein
MSQHDKALPPVVSQAEWQVARDRLLIKEKAATQARDALAAERRRLPMVKIDKDYVFEGSTGNARLFDMFDGRRQLIMYHVMFGPTWKEGFREFGRSGLIYSREAVLEEFLVQPMNYKVLSQDYEADVLAEDVVVLTYRSAHIANDGSLTHFTNRTSIWQLTDCVWRVRFHQGTPCEPFERVAA